MADATCRGARTDRYEGTAIFKYTNNPPVGESKFLDYGGLPSDHYLWLLGQGGRLIRNEIKPTDEPPSRD